MAIRDWPESERPRERLLQLGAGQLTDGELLALFLRVGVRGKSAVELARDLLHHFGSLGRLCHASAEEFAAIPGVGLAKYAQLQAVMELARRALAEEMQERDLLASPQAARDWLRLRLGPMGHEVFMVLLLDAQNQLIKACELFRGTLTQTSVFPRDVVKLALDHGAANLILAHNHPSGLAEPSAADRQLTQTLKMALGLIDVQILDHFVIGGRGGIVSFAERGLL